MYAYWCTLICCLVFFSTAYDNFEFATTREVEEEELRVTIFLIGI